MLTLLIVRLALALVLVRVTVLTALTVPASRLPKARPAGEKETFDATEPEPVPLRSTGWVPSPASVDTVNAPGIEPDTVGAKVTLILQVCPADSEVGQLLV